MVLIAWLKEIMACIWRKCYCKAVFRAISVSSEAIVFTCRSLLLVINIPNDDIYICYRVSRVLASRTMYLAFYYTTERWWLILGQFFKEWINQSWVNVMLLALSVYIYKAFNFVIAKLNFAHKRSPNWLKSSISLQ